METIKSVHDLAFVLVFIALVLAPLSGRSQIGGFVMMNPL